MYSYTDYLLAHQIQTWKLELVIEALREIIKDGGNEAVETAMAALQEIGELIEEGK